MTERYSHLAPVSRAMADETDEARIAYLNKGGWFAYPRAQAIVEHLEEMYAWPKRARMPNAVVIAVSNNGKTSTLEEIERRHPSVDEEGRVRRSVLMVQMPSDPTENLLYREILEKLGVGFLGARRAVDPGRTARQLMRDIGVRMLIIDELHNINSASARMAGVLLNTLRFIGNDLRIPVVGAGTHAALIALRSDPQLENRFKPFVLPPWTANQETRSLLASFAAFYPLREESLISTTRMMSYLLSRTEGTIGEMSDLLGEAARIAIRTGREAITEEILEQCEYEGPTNRRPKYAG